MREILRIFEGDTVHTIQLEPFAPFVIGTNKNADYQIKTDNCNEVSIQISSSFGSRRAECSGAVLFNGEPIRELELRHADMLVLDEKRQVAVHYLNMKEEAAKWINLNDFQEVTVGRGKSCTIQLKHPRVSGVHAKLYRTASTDWQIKDENSTNGTYINGAKIRSSDLEDETRIVIGSFELELAGGKLWVYGEPSEIKLNLPEEMTTGKEYPYFTTSPRIIKEKVSGELEIEAAPKIGEKPETNWLSVLLPSLGTTGIMIAMVLITNMSKTMLMFSVPMSIISVFLAIYNYRRQAKKYQDTEKLRKNKYQQYLDGCEKQLADAAKLQRDIAEYANPDPSLCFKMAKQLDRRLWERTIHDEDFLSLRIGVGQVKLGVTVKTPKVGLVLNEDSFDRMPEKLAESYKNVDKVPITCDLLRTPTLGVIGRRIDAIHVVHAMIVQAATLHSYDALKIILLYPESEADQWTWMRWLPHMFDENREVRFIASNHFGAARILESVTEELKQRTGKETGSVWKKKVSVPHYLLVAADPTLLEGQALTEYLNRNDAELGLSCIALAHTLGELPQSVKQILEAKPKDAALYHRNTAAAKCLFQPDLVSVKECEAFARALAPVRLPEKNAAKMLPSMVSFLDGYHVRTPEDLDIGDRWANSYNYQSMAVPIGVRANGDSFYFDIHEKKHGPHGLVAGTTGSGKTEMVQSWILSMATQFSPQDVAFVLVDFKGTGLILPFSNLPHVAGTISDLDKNISRNLVALRSELQRRKMLFDQAGVNKISDYLKAYRSGKVTEPLPYLFVVIDEYAEFKSQFPEFTSEVNSLFTTGRSLGVHIILMTQNPSGIVSAQSETNVKFRWCLKVAGVAASKEVLGGHEEAARITNPGSAYVRVGNDELFERIQSFYSGAPYEPNKNSEPLADTSVSAVSLDGTRTSTHKTAQKKASGRRTEIDCVVDYISKYAAQHGIPAARHIWQSKIPETIYLPDLLSVADRHAPGELIPVVGLIDDPASQKQYPLQLPLSECGHAAVYGSPGSGKTTFLQTLVVSLCTQYSPEEVNLYLMDFGSWSLGMFKDYPHVGGIANDNDEEKIGKMVQLLENTLEERKRLFSQEGVGSLPAYLQTGREKLPYIVLVIDDLAGMRQQYAQYDDFLLKLAQRGGNYGIYLVATVNSAMALGYKLSQSIKTNIVLQMTDKGEYASLLGKTNGMIPENCPGRGLCRDGRVMEFQTALPAAGETDFARSSAVRGIGAELSKKWGKSKAVTVATMPPVIGYGTVQAPSGQILGLKSNDLAPLSVDLMNPHHWLISGMPGAGKTTLVKMLARQVRANSAVFGSEKDYGSLEGIHLLKTGAELDVFLTALSAELTQRQQEKNQNPQAEFEPIYLLIDGYKRMFDEISQQSVGRLQAIVMMGKNLGVSLVASENNMEISSMVGMGETVLSRLTKGMLIVLGGSAAQHMRVEIPMDYQEKSKKLGKFEAYLVEDQNVTKFKVMNCE